MNTTFLKSLLAIAVFSLLPAAGLAATPWQGTITTIGEKEFALRYKSLAESRFYTCATSTLTCTYHGTATSSVPTLTPLVATSTEGTSVARSLSGRFIARFTPATASRIERTFSLTDTTTNQEYKQVGTATYWDLLSEEFKLFAFNPNETRMIYLDDRDGQPTLYHVDLTASPINMAGTRLITRTYSVSDFIFIDNDRILFTANREHPLRWSLYEYNIKTESLKKVSDNASYGVPLKRIGSYIAFGKINTNVSDILFYDPATGLVKTATSTQAFPQPAIEPAQEAISFGTLHGAVLKPDNFSPTKAYPLILWLHGGPYRQTSIGYHSYPSYAVYDQILESFRQRGFIVVKLDYSGSYGYGRPFAEKLQNRVGDVDVADVVTAVNSLKSRYTISSVYPMGNSYGGYLALKAAAEKPALFNGVISIAGVTDWQALLTKIPDSIFKVHFQGPPTALNQHLYDKASITKLANVLGKKKVLLVHGQADNSVPLEQADILYSLLPLKTSTFIALPGEDHVFARPESLEEICRGSAAVLGVTIPAGTSCLR